MQTLTQVTDPYFGQYFELFMTPEVIWWVGPAARRTLRTGSIETTGPIARTHGTVREKCCWHRGVHGTMYGVRPPFKYHVSPFSDDAWQQVTNIGGGYLIYSDCVLTVSETRSTATLTARVDRWATYRGRLDPSWTKWAKITALFKKSEDPLTHNVTYTYVSTLKREGDYLLPSPNVVPCGCPYTAPPGYTGIAIQNARYWHDRTLALRKRDRRQELAARDEAIFNALESVSVTDISWLESGQDAAAPLDSIRSLYKVFSSGPWWIRALKGGSSLKLFWDYVIQNGILDAQSVSDLVRFLQVGRRIDGLGAFGHLVGHGSSSVSRSGDSWSEEQEWHAKVVLSPGWGPFSSLSELQLLGILPTAVSIWDATPFSFVVDWVLPVGKMLQHGSDLVATINCPLLWIVVSRKSTIGYNKRWVDDAGHVINCALTEVDYERTVIHDMPRSMGQLYLDNPSKHWLNGLALVIQQVL